MRSRLSKSRCTYDVQRIMQHISDVVWIIDEHTRIMFELPSSKRMLGYDDNYLTGKVGLDFVHPDDVENVQALLAILKSDAAAVEPAEFRFRHADGSWRWLIARAKNLLNDDSIRGIVVTVNDITEKRKTEKLLELQNTIALQLMISRDLNELVQNSILAAMALIKMDSGGLLLLNNDGNDLVLHNAIGWTEQVKTDTNRIRQNSVLFRLIASGSQHVFSISELESLHDGTFRKGGYNTVFFQPLMNEKSVIGCLIITSELNVVPGYPERQALETMATQLATLIIRAQIQQTLKENERRLAQSNKMLQLVLDTIPVRVFWKDRSLRYLGCNQLFAQDAGVPNPEYLIGRNDKDLVWKNEAEAYQADDRAVMKNLQPKLNFEEVQTTPKGDKIWLRTSKIPLKDIDDQLLGVLGTYEEITQQKQMEARQTRLISIIETSDDFIAMATLDGKIHFINKAGAVLMDVSEPDALIGTNIFDLLEKRSGESIKATVDKTLAEAKRYQREIELKRQEDGSVIYGDLTIMTLPDHNSSLESRIVVIIRDMTEERLSERALKESEQRFQSIIQNIRDIIWMIDSNGTIYFASPSCAEKLGYSDEVMIGSHIQQFVHPDEKAKILALLNEPLESNDSKRKMIECRFLQANGHYRSLEMVISDMLDEQGKANIIITARDITERKKAEASRAKLEEQLQQAQKMEAIGQLAGGIAHDFNNLLIAILGNAELVLADLPENSYLFEDVKEIEKAAEKAASLTRQLLAFSRRQAIQPRKLKLNEVVTNMEKLLKRLIGEDIQLKLTLDDGLPAVTADPGQIEQVVMNLVVNARDAMPGGGKLNIRTWSTEITNEHLSEMTEARPGKFVVMSVQDNGIGMSNKILPQIFEPFFSTKMPGEGTGLGLSVVYGVVKQHKGWIHVESEPGKGTTFHVYLPAVQVDEQEIRTEIASMKQLAGYGQRILFVDDDKEVRKLTSKLLRKYGYVVETAECAEQAMQIFTTENGQIDLLFADVILPDKNGVKLANELRKKKSDLLVILCSGYSTHKLDWEQIQSCGYSFIQKPYSMVKLLKLIQKQFQPVEISTD